MHRHLTALIILLAFAAPALTHAQTTPDPLTIPSASLTQEQRAAVIAQLQQLILQLTQQLQTIIAAKEQQRSGGNASGVSTVCTVERTLALGMKGDDVKCLQTYLISQNLLAPDSVTGYFGPLTRAAVIALQQQHNLEQVGHVGKLTRSIMNMGITRDGQERAAAAAPVPTPQQPPITPPPSGGGGSGGGSSGGGDDGGGGTGGDTTPPLVSITAPAAGTTVSGVITIAAAASDPSSPSGQATSGIAGVQFAVDGANLNAEDTIAPYSVDWNTLSTTNGIHTITAAARDVAGNRATSTTGVTVNNAVSVVPTVAALYPARFVPGTPVTIGGTGFNATRNVITVSGAGNKTFVVPAVQGGTLLTFTFPTTLPAGAYSLTVNNGSQTSAPFSFTVVPSFALRTPPSTVSAHSLLTITPNPCILDATGKCTTIVHWETPATATMLWASKNGAPPVLVACLGKNGTSTIPWIVGGNIYEFSVYAASSCLEKPTTPNGLEWLASVSTAGVPSGSLRFPPVNIGAVHLELFNQYQGRNGQGAQGTDAEMVVQRAMARKALDDAKMLGGANYVRIGPGWWPQDLALWMHDPAAYWSIMDTAVHDMHARGLAMVPDLTWHFAMYATLVGETTADFYGNPDSAAYKLWAKYVREFVTRYKNDPQASIYFYMIGNESNLAADLDAHAGKCAEFTGWLCANTGNMSTNQMIAFQSRAAALIRTLDPVHPISSGDAIARSSAWHLMKKPAWAGGPDWTLDSREELKKYLAYINQELDLVELHFYNYPQGGSRNNERFCPGADCISGANNAGLLDVYKEVADSMGKKVHIGEYGDFDPYLKDFLPQYGPFVQNILDKTVALGIPYSAPWSFEFYASRTSTYSQSGSYQNIEPGYADLLLTELRSKNTSLGSTSVAPSIAIPLIHIVLTNPLDGSALAGTSTLLYAVASAPRIGASIQKVQFSVDGTIVATVTAPPYRFTLAHTALRAGTHAIKANATDTAGHIAETSAVQITCAAAVCTAP